MTDKTGDKTPEEEAASKVADRFTQPANSIRTVEEEGGFRDLPLKKQRERMRTMYRDVQPGEPK